MCPIQIVYIRGLNILNSGLILKSFTHELRRSVVRSAKCTANQEGPTDVSLHLQVTVNSEIFVSVLLSNGKCEINLSFTDDGK